NVVSAIAFTRFLVESLNIAQGMRESQPRHPYLISRQSIEHEGVVGIRTVRNRDLARERGRAAVLSGLRRGGERAHALTLEARCQPPAIAAANITLMTSAKMNE